MKSCGTIASQVEAYYRYRFVTENFRRYKVSESSSESIFEDLREDLEALNRKFAAAVNQNREYSKKKRHWKTFFSDYLGVHYHSKLSYQTTSTMIV